MSTSAPEIRVTPALRRHFKAAVEAAIRAIEYLENDYYQKLNQRNDTLKEAADDANKDKIKTDEELRQQAETIARKMLRTSWTPKNIDDTNEALTAHWVWQNYCFSVFADPTLPLSLPGEPLESLTEMLNGSVDPNQQHLYEAKHAMAQNSSPPLRVFHHYTDQLRSYEEVIRGKVESGRYNEFPKIPLIPQELLDSCPS